MSAVLGVAGGGGSMIQIDRRAFLGRSAAAAAFALAAPPLWARGPQSFPAADREMFLPVPGGRVYVRINGRLDGPRPPLVLVHGGPGGTHGGLLPALALADERAIILYDQLGSGRSDPGSSADWTVARFTDELDAVRRGLGIKRWHVEGHSWGGTVALEYGARRPPELAGLVLASPLISTRSWIADTNALRTRLPADVQAVLDSCDPPRPITPACDPATEAFSKAFTSREPRMGALVAYAKAQEAAGGKGFNKGLYEAMWGPTEFVATGTLKEYDGEPLLARLDGPRTLFVVGQYDEARPATANLFADRVAGAEFAVVPGAAHSLFNDRPEETIGILRPWLARQDAA